MMRDSTRQALEGAPSFKQFAAAGAGDPAAMTSNQEVPWDPVAVLREATSEPAVGEDHGTLFDVPGFALRHSDWSEDVPESLMGLPHIETEALFGDQKSICGKDDRALIGNTTAAPWKFICKLYVDNKWVASGFFIGSRCIITNGHVVFPDGAWAKQITVIPGQNGKTAPFGSQKSARLFSVNGWTKSKNPDYDYGAVILPDDTLYRRLQGYFGYQILNSSQLLNNSGYPADKPQGTQWFNAGAITKLGDRRFFYMLDSAGGQSGSPVFIRSGASATVVGVHGYGGCPNSAVRLVSEVKANWDHWRTL